jgi:putative peptidoglycan binding protein
VTEFADSQVVYRDLDGLWGSFRLVVGGKDVTYFRGVPAQIGGYQLTEPYGFGPADFGLPQLTPFEVDAWGTGELRWMGNGKPVRLVQVDADGSFVRKVWEGLVTAAEVTTGGVLLHCDGKASGRLAMRAKLPDLFAIRHPVGRKIYAAFQRVNLQVTPYLGGLVGDIVDGRGYSGSYLDYVDGLLAQTIDVDGTQYTVMPHTDGTWHLGLKDTDTIDCTAHYGATGVDIDLTDDLTERPNAVYGSGVSPEGLVWVNGRYPGLIQGTAPDYPMDDSSAFGSGTTDADTDSGDGVTVMMEKLIGMGYLSRIKKPGGYDSDVTSAVEELQDDAGLTSSGNMNPATWDALFDENVTGFSLAQSYIMPLAQKPVVRKWLTTANGSLASRNPAFDPSIPQVDLAVDHGTGVEKARARRYSQGIIHRIGDKNWAGTIVLTSDVFAGDHSHTDVDPTVMSRLDINAGMNLKLRHFDAGTLFHVAIVNVSSDLSVTLGVDTQARDAATLGEVIARRIESRAHPARQWKRQHLAGANVRRVEFSEVGGLVYNKVACPANEWTVFPVIAGQAGSVARVRIQTSDDEAAFCVAITAQRTWPSFWHSKIGNPLDGAALDDISLNNSGSGYTSATVSFLGGGGSGATATATVSGGLVTDLTLTDGGTGYVAPPTVIISGDGSGAKGSASVTLPQPWTSTKVSKLIDSERALLYATGTPDQPAGYHPGSLTNNKGLISGDDVTGLLLDDAGFDYHTFAQPVVYVAIYPDRDTVIKPQRVLWETLESTA